MMLGSLFAGEFALSRQALPVLALALLATPLGAQQQDQADPADPDRQALAAEAYLEPSAPIREAVLAPRYRNVTLRGLDPRGQLFLHSVEDGFPALASFARPHYNLGGFQVDPAADRSRRLTTRSDVGYELIPADGGQRISVEVPEGARVSGGTWSPDGTRLAFLAHFDDGSHVYVADADDGDSRRVTRQPVLATLVTGVEWTPDGQHIVTVLPPEDRGPEPVRPEVPTTPMVRLTSDGENRLRTYFDLLEDPHEIALVEYFTTGQLALIEVDSRSVERIGAPRMIEGVDVAPDGSHFRVERWKPPFSYIVPTTSVGSVEELWDRDGEVVATLDEQELRDGRDDDDDDEEEDEEDEKRGLTWAVDGRGLVYLQMEPRPDSSETSDAEAAAEEQESGEERPRRMDRVIRWLPPYGDDDVEIIYESRRRMNSVSFDADGRTLFITRRSGGDDDGRETLSAVFLDEEEPEEHEIFSHQRSEWKEDPGSPLFSRNELGRPVVRTSPDGASVYLSGTQYSDEPLEEAPRPFLDRVEIRSGEKERIFESSPDAYERITDVLDDELRNVIVLRESPREIPDSWRMDLVTGERRNLTQNTDYTPEITAARRELLTVTRPDGFVSKVEVTLPAGYQEGTRLPAMFWFYPREYTEQESYDERNIERHNKNQFPSIGARSMEILTLAGYAVVQPDLPVVGESGQMNDNYIQDLRNTLATVIDSLDARGWIDRHRLGIGGHSYGAFGTANAMVHTPFFKAGIAGDGNYNRSLTPAGFQSERRHLWEAEQVYLEMSPFFFAERLTGALLMYHGMDDHNVGTHPDHARRMFHALNVLGKDASLYMYPYEDHGPATRETTLDLWARWSTWLDEYVKNQGRTSQPVVSDEEGGRER